MGRLYIQHLSGEKIYKCKFCRVDSASRDDIYSKEFNGRYGRGYLMTKVLLGWRYEKAYEESQKYKEGMYLLEKERTLKDG